MFLPVKEIFAEPSSVLALHHAITIHVQNFAELPSNRFYVSYLQTPAIYAYPHQYKDKHVLKLTINYGQKQKLARLRLVFPPCFYTAKLNISGSQY
ncbi:hypothetical protein G9A89_008002 [Geosiphon pyriformis]|nr:hypothetical protein G9A89_008002 [Geosiphon pyriformis]